MSNPLISRAEAILRNILGGDLDLEKPRSRIEVLLLALMRMIEELEPGGGSSWLGETTTELYDGCTTNEIEIDGELIAVKVGDMASYDHEEFIFDGEAWQALGQYITIDEEPEEDSPNAVSSGGVYSELTDIQALIASLDDRITALEENSSSDLEIDSEGYLLINEESIDEFGYLETNAEIEEEYLVANSGGSISDLDIVVTSGTITLTGDNAEIRDGKLIFDSSISGILNFESEGGGGGDGHYEFVDDELVLDDGAEIDNGYLLMVGDVIDEYYSI